MRFSKLKGVPHDAVAYRTTAALRPSTLPQALTRVHRTKPGVWGVIAVDSGALRLVRQADPGSAAAARIEVVEAGGTAIVAPDEPHAISFVAPGSFTITFFRTPKPAELTRPTAEANDPAAARDRVSQLWLLRHRRGAVIA